MTPRSRNWRALLTVLLAIILLLSGVYSYFAFAPTGYDEIVATHTARQAEIASYFQFDDASSTSSIAADATDAIPPSSAPPPKTANELLKAFEESKWAERNPLYRALRDHPSQLKGIKLNFPDDLVPDKDLLTVFGNNPQLARNFHAGIELSMRQQAATFPLPDAYWEAILTPPVREAMALLRSYAEFEPRPFTPSDRNLSSGLFSVHRLVHLCGIERLQNDDPQAATRVILRALDLFRWLQIRNYLSDHKDYYGDFTFEFHWLRYFLVAVASDQRMPSEELDALQLRLEQMTWTPDQIQTLHIAAMTRWRDRYQAWLDSGASFSENAWHFFLDGAPERAILASARPLLNRELDQIVLAAVRGQLNRSSSTDYRRLVKLMNLARTRDVRFPSTSMIETFNEELRWCRMVFALARFRRENGKVPSSIEELIPRYLSSSWPETPDERNRYRFIEIQINNRQLIGVYSLTTGLPLSELNTILDSPQILPSPDNRNNYVRRCELLYWFIHKGVDQP